MVNISIDVTDLGGEARPGDKVVLWKPAAAGSSIHAGRVISTAPVDVFLTNGKASVPDVEPGEMRVLLQCRGVESQGPIDVTVPDGNGTVTLRSLIESQFEYAPPIVSAVQEAAANASASERAAIEAQVRSEAAADRAEDRVDEAINNGAALVRDEVKQDADRAVSARQAATQSESNAAASEGAAASSASNAAASESAAKQSETNAGDYAAVATTAATEAVDAMDSVSDIIGANYATREYVDSAKWLQTAQLPANTDFDTVRTPAVRIMLGGTHSSAPFNSLGVLEVMPIAYGGTMQRATSWATLEVYKRRTQGGVFQAWVKEPTLANIPSLQSVQNMVDAAVGEIDIPSNDWTRRVPLAVTTGAGAAEGPGEGSYRIRCQFTAPVTRWRLHVSTRYPIFTTTRGGATIANIGIGENLGSGGIGDVTTLESDPVTIAAGNEWVSDWLTYDLRDDSLLSMDVTPEGSHYNMLAPAWKLENDVWVQKNRAPLWVWIEAETYADTPTVALIGDSTGAGHGSIEPVWDSAVAIAGRKQEFLPVLYASSGDTLSGNITADDPNFARWVGYGLVDSVVIQAGSNDLNAGKTLAEIQASFADVVGVAKGLGVKVYAATIRPRYPTDTVAEVRVPYNEWLRTLPHGIDGVIDYDKAVAPDGVILAEDNDDGAHLKKSGHEKMAEAYSYPIAKPRVNGWVGQQGEEQASSVDTGDIDIAHLIQGATVTYANIRRVGNLVYLDLQNVKPTTLTSGGSFLGALPAGFKPTRRRDFSIRTGLTSGTFRSAFQFVSGAVGCWLPSVDDRYDLNLSWPTNDAWPAV